MSVLSCTSLNKIWSMIFPRYATFLHFRIFSQHCQQGWLLPCSRFSVSQNFCSSLKYLSRMYTFDVPIPAILTTGGHHWLPLCRRARPKSSRGPQSVFLLSHILETVLPAGRPSTGCSPMGAPHRAKRPNSGAHHCSALLPTSTTTWLHVTRVPAVVGGSR